MNKQYNTHNIHIFTWIYVCSILYRRKVWVGEGLVNLKNCLLFTKPCKSATHCLHLIPVDRSFQLPSFIAKCSKRVNSSNFYPPNFLAF